MKRRTFLLTTMTTGAAGLGLTSALRAKTPRPETASADGAASPRKPNILWIIAEDMNPWLSCYGTTLIHTPALDGMAALGVRFDRAYVTAPVCSPCRSAFITGTMQTTLGIHNHRSSRSNAKNPCTRIWG